jgi:hypothetical protein
MNPRNPNRKPLCVGSAIGLGVCVAATSAAIACEATPKTVREAVTGSNIVRNVERPANQGALPVTTLDRRYIERSGTTDAAELIQSLPVMQNSPGSAIVVRPPGGALR